MAFTGLLTLIILAVPAVAAATFTRATAAAMPVASDTLTPPTNVKVTCAGAGHRITVSWTATADAYATGYVVYRKRNGSESSNSVSGGTTTSYTPNATVSSGTVVTVAATYRNWTSNRSAGVTTSTCP